MSVQRFRARLRARLARRFGDDRGATLVEAAIVLPVMLMITFGTIEYGLAMANSSTLKQSTRSAVRMVSTSPKTEAYGLAEDAAKTTLANTTFLVPEEMRIYKADPETGQPVGGCPGTTCLVYTWTGTGWGTPAGSWAPASQYACLVTTVSPPRYPDAVGVSIRARHEFVTGFFGDSLSMTERTTMRLEPVPSANGCANTTNP
jgi:hypothetical protein